MIIRHVNHHLGVARLSIISQQPWLPSSQFSSSKHIVTMEDSSSIQVSEKVRDIAKWPTDTVEIDYWHSVKSANQKCNLEYPHTIIIFFPGNPGLSGW